MAQALATPPASKAAPEALPEPTTPATFLEIDPDLVDPHPANPRGELSPSAIADLEPLIEAQGQKDPALVRPRPGGRYQAIFGHRRRLVAKVLGRKLRCVVEDISDDLALALLATEGGSHLPPDPVREAEAVAQLLERNPIEQVAALMGKPTKWVALRANLRTLSKKVRDRWKNPADAIHRWPIAWLEELAKLAPATQDKLADDSWILEDIRTGEELEKLLADELHVLGKAPWELDDDKLVPKAGSCAKCPKTSARSPGLFDEDLDPANPDELARAQCRDSACWEKKGEAHRLVKIEKLKAETGAALVVKGDYSAKIPAGVKALDRWEADQHKVKKGEAGAVPAIVVGGHDDGKTVWLKDVPGVKAPKEAPAAKKKEPEKKAETAAEYSARLKSSKEGIERRRLAHVVDAVRDAILAQKDPPPRAAVLGLVAAFGVKGPSATAREPYALSSAAPKRRQNLYQLGTSGPAWDAEVWLRMREWVADPLKRHVAEQLDDQHELAVKLAAILAMDLAGLEAEAKAEIPDPKWWGTAETTTYAPKAAAKIGRATKRVEAEGALDRKRIAAGEREDLDEEDADSVPLAPLLRKGKKAGAKKGGRKS